MALLRDPLFDPNRMHYRSYWAWKRLVDAFNFDLTLLFMTLNKRKESWM